MTRQQRRKQERENQINKYAQKVIDVFPSFNELINNDKYGANYIINPFVRFAFSKSNQWEGIAQGINNMCNNMYERDFYNSYASSSDTKGYADVLPAFGNSIKVDIVEFKALLKIMMLFNMGLVQPTEEQYEAYLDFKSSDSRIYKILD